VVGDPQTPIELYISKDYECDLQRCRRM